MKKKPPANARTRNILLLLWSTGASGRDFLIGFSRFARTLPEWRLHMRHVSDFPNSDVVRAAVKGGYDGIVTGADTLRNFPELASNSRTAIVTFSTYRKIDTPARVVFVQNDNAEIGRHGARYLSSLGNFRSFGFVPTNLSHDWSAIRAESFRAELAGHRRPCHIFGEEDSRMPLKVWLRRLPKPAAVMAACDTRALEVIATCARAGLTVPAQVAVLGVDNDELLCEFESPTLSSVLPRHDETGYLAAKTLNRLLRGWRPKDPKRILYSEQTIVERESTAPLAPATHLIRDALEFIRQNATKNIRVTDVVEHLHVSRSLADLRFREFQGETIRETITRIRLDEVKKRLLSTKIPVGKLARVCGFSNVSHLEVMFRRRFGMSMGRWRTANAR